MVIKVLFFLFPVCLFCNPKGAKIVEGTCSIKEKEKELEIKASDRSIIHWNDFSIETQERTKFVQPTSSSVVLNRITSDKVSKISGLLEANGNIILINPNGIVVTKNGMIHASSIIASTLDIQNNAYIKNQELEFTSGKKSAVLHYGKMQATGGDIIIMGYSSQNHGSCVAQKGQVHLLGAEKVLLKPSDSKKIYIETKNVDNQSCIDTLNPYSHAISSIKEEDALNVLEQEGQIYLVTSSVLSGKIRSKHKGNGGKVSLLAKTVLVEDQAFIDVSSPKGGGSIVIGGGFEGNDPSYINSTLTIVQKDAFLNAKATKEGHGGAVVLWSDGYTHFAGTIDVRGGKKQGNGGIVEVSGKKGLSFLGKTYRTSKNGLSGKLFLDPDADVIIHHDNAYGGSFIQNKWIPLKNESYIEIGNKSTPGTLLYELQQGDVLIQTQGQDFADSGGNIIIKDDIIYHLLPGNHLSLSAKGDIYLKGKLVNTGPGDIIIEQCNNLFLDALTEKKNLALSCYQGSVHIKNIQDTLYVKGGEKHFALIGYHQCRKPIYGNVYIENIGNSLLLEGGPGKEGFALIGSYKAPSCLGNISIKNIQKDLVLQAQEGFCQIGHTQTTEPGFLYGDIAIDTIQGSVFLHSSETAKAHIGHGSLGDFPYEQKGLISVLNVHKNIVLSSQGMFTQIGHANKLGENANKIGDITLEAGEDIFLQAGDTDSSYALIGHGGMQGSFDRSLLQSNISILSGKDVLLQGGNGYSFSAIGFALQDIAIAQPVKIKSQQIKIEAKKAITLHSGSGSSAVIGGYLPLNPNKAYLNVKKLIIRSANNIHLEGFSKENARQGKYAEAVIGFFKDPSYALDQYSGDFGLHIEAGKNITLKGSCLAEKEHPVFLRGINKRVFSSIIAEENISFLAQDQGQAALAHYGPIRMHSRKGCVEFLSSEEKEAYAEVFGGNLEILSKQKICLKDETHPSGKLYIFKDQDKKSPNIFYSGDIYWENGHKEGSIDVITITQTEEKKEDLNIIKASDDMIFMNTFDPDSSFLTLTCNDKAFHTCYQNASIEALYQANIRVSEFLYRITPLIEYLGYRENFCLCKVKFNKPYCRNCYYIRQPYIFLKAKDTNPFYW